MKTRRNLSFVLALAMIFQAFLVFPGAAFAEDTDSADAEEETLYTLTFIVNGKIAQRRYAHAGEALVKSLLGQHDLAAGRIVDIDLPSFEAF